MISVTGVRKASGFDAGTVTIMLGMLESIHEEACDDIVMADFADTVGSAILQLRDLQRLAYETMLEIESERASGRFGQTRPRRKAS